MEEVAAAALGAVEALDIALFVDRDGVLQVEAVESAKLEKAAAPAVVVGSFLAVADVKVPRNILETQCLKLVDMAEKVHENLTSSLIKVQSLGLRGTRPSASASGHGS